MLGHSQWASKGGVVSAQMGVSLWGMVSPDGGGVSLWRGSAHWGGGYGPALHNHMMVSCDQVTVGGTLGLYADTVFLFCAGVVCV